MSGSEIKSETLHCIEVSDSDFHWVRSGVYHLIDIVSKRFDDFYDRTIKKKTLWKEIAEEMQKAGHICSADDCDRKWRNLRKTYVSVLQKQVAGDFSCRFAYFPQMHALLGKEIDPQGMREQGLKKVASNVGSKETETIITEDIQNESNQDWTDLSVIMLLDLIVEYRDFLSGEFQDTEAVWDTISEKMCEAGHKVTSDQCQHQWLKLSFLFEHHQSETALTGNITTWKFFTRVKRVMGTINTSSEALEDMKPLAAVVQGSVKQPHEKSLGRPPFKRFKSENCFRQSSDEDLKSRVTVLESQLNPSLWIDYLEKRVDSAKKLKSTVRQTNCLLSILLSKMRKINSALSIQNSSIMEEKIKIEKKNPSVSGVIVVEGL